MYKGDQNVCCFGKVRAELCFFKPLVLILYRDRLVCGRMWPGIVARGALVTKGMQIRTNNLVMAVVQRICALSEL